MTVTEISRHIAAEKELARQLEKHAGKWVAVSDHEIVAVARTSGRLLEQIRGKDIDRYFRVTSGAALL